MLFYANSLIVIEFCHDSIKKNNFLYFRCSKNCLFDFSLYLCSRRQRVRATPRQFLRPFGSKRPEVERK